MRVRLVSRPLPPYSTSCDCCGGGQRRCVRFHMPVQQGLDPSFGERTFDVCRSCISEGLRIAITGRKREGSS